MFCFRLGGWAVVLPLLLLGITACSNGSSGTSPVSPLVAGPRSASVALTIAWPRSAARNAKRRPAYVSAATQSLTVSVAGTHVLEADNPSSGAAVTKTYAISVAPGLQQSFLVALYDGTGGTGNLLGRSVTLQDVVIDKANQLTIVVDGQLAKIGIVPIANPYLETGVSGATYTLVGPLAQTFALIPEDADGYTIVSPGKIPPLTLTSPTAAIVATAVPNSTDNAYTIAGPVPTTSITLTAQGTDLNGTIVKATFTAQILAALFVTDPVAHRIAVLDDKGDALTFPSTAFADVRDTHNCGPHGITYVAPTSAHPIPELYVARCTGNPSAGGPGNIGIFDLLGNEIAPATAMAPNQPQFLTYDPGANSGMGAIIVADSGNTDSDASIEMYGLDGTPTFNNSGPHPRLFEQANAPSKVAFDPTLASPDYMITDGTGYVERYAHDGTFISKTAAGTSPGGIAYDTNNKRYYVTTYGSAVPGNVAVGERGTLYAFDATLTQQTTGTANALAFMNLSSRPTDVVFDPYNLVLYVANYAGNNIMTFNEDGSASTQFASPVTSIVDPLGLALAP